LILVQEMSLRVAPFSGVMWRGVFWCTA